MPSLRILLTLAVLAGAEADTFGERQAPAEIQKLIREGDALWNGRQFAAASQKLAEALRRSEELGDLRLQARSLDLLGSVAEGLGEVALGRERHRRALDLARAAGDRAVEAKVHEHIGRGCWSRADYGCARESYGAALEILHDLGDRAGEASMMEALSWVHLKQGAFAEARAHLDRAHEIAIAAGSRFAQGAVLRSLGFLAREQGDFRAGVDRFQESLALWRHMGNRAEEFETLKEIGVTYALNGAPEEALVWYSRALELAERDGDPHRKASALFTMGRAHHRNGDGARALEYLRQSLAIRERFEDREKQGWCWSFMGDVHAAQGELDLALAAYRRALEAWEQVGARRPIGTLLADLGEVCLKQGLEADALSYFERAVRAGEEIDLPYRTAALSGLARIRSGRGEHDEALSLARQAADLAAKCDMPGLEWAALAVRGRVERRFGRRDEALRSFEDSLEALERLRRQSIPEDRVKSGFLEDKQVVYEEAIALAIDLGRVSDALLFAERARARAFVDLLSGRELAARPLDREILEQIRKLESTLRRGDGSARDLPEPGGGSKNGGPLRSHDASKAILEKLKAENAELLSLVSVPPLRLSDLEAEVRRRRATLVEYFCGEEKLFIWILGPGGPVESAVSPIGRADIERLVRELREDLNIRLEKSDPLPALRRLYEHLVKPIEKRLPAGRDSPVIVVPHRELFLISFAALLDPQGRFLVERHKFSVAPAASVLAYTRRNRDRVIHAGAPRVLAVGNPVMPPRAANEVSLAQLPGAEEEVRSLAHRFPPERLTLITGERAREGLVRALAPGETVLHFATHAVLREDPLASLIALTPEEGGGPDSDGLLTVREVFGLDLHADLVVLSACNTGLGRISGDGVIGLSRAFIHAGAASVVVSLWRVSDLAARSLMEEFYAVLAEKKGDKAGALREAQLRLLDRLRRGDVQAPGGRPLRAHPIHWAPFVLVGETE